MKTKQTTLIPLESEEKQYFNLYNFEIEKPIDVKIIKRCPDEFLRFKGERSFIIETRGGKRYRTKGHLLLFRYMSRFKLGTWVTVTNQGIRPKGRTYYYKVVASKKQN